MLLLLLEVFTVTNVIEATKKNAEKSKLAIWLVFVCNFIFIFNSLHVMPIEPNTAYLSSSHLFSADSILFQLIIIFGILLLFFFFLPHCCSALFNIINFICFDCAIQLCFFHVFFPQKRKIDRYIDLFQWFSTI